MPRAQLAEAEERIARGLQQLRVCAGWTITETSGALDVKVETLRGVLFRKNRPGPYVLRQLIAFADRANPRRVGADVFAVAQQIAERAGELLGPRSLDDRLDSLYRNVVSDFDGPENLLDFLGVDADEWDRFAEGEEPSSDLLAAIARAYLAEAARVSQQDAVDAAWCRQIAEAALNAAEHVAA